MNLITLEEALDLTRIPTNWWMESDASEYVHPQILGTSHGTPLSEKYIFSKVVTMGGNITAYPPAHIKALYFESLIRRITPVKGYVEKDDTLYVLEVEYFQAPSRKRIFISQALPAPCPVQERFDELLKNRRPYGGDSFKPAKTPSEAIRRMLAYYGISGGEK